MKSYHMITNDQQKAVDRLFEHDETYLYAKPGTGKTVIVLTALQELFKEGALNRVLIVAPLRVCQLTWATEHLEWGHTKDMDINLCLGTESARLAALESASTRCNCIVVINFENIVWLLRETKFARMFDGLVIDELTKLKSGGGTIFKAMRGKLKHINYRVGMTGTPVAENFEGLYGQVMMVDKGLRLGTRKDRFMSEYFFPTDYQRYNWELKPGGGARIVATIKDLIHTVPDYRSDLPALTYFKPLLTLPDEAREVYTTLAKTMLIDLDEGAVEAQNAAVLQAKLQQVANGFLYLENPIDGVRSVSTIHDTKFRALKHLMDTNAPESGGVMIVYTHTEELDRLLEMYPDAGVLGAGVTAKKAAEYVRLWNARALDILIVHPKSSGHGLNLAAGGYRMIWVSPCWSLDLYEQTIARIWRRGQVSDVLVTVLLMRDTVDELIMSRLDGKAEHELAFISHLKNQTR